VTVTRTLVRELMDQAGLYREALVRALSHRESHLLRIELAEAEAAIADASAGLAELDASSAPPLVVVVPCGAAKRPRRTTAGDMYTGGYHRACRRYAVRFGADRILVLSARHGLLDLDEPIDPYELRMGQPGSVTTAAIRRQAERLAVASADVVLLGGRAYVERAAPVWPQARTPLAHVGGIGRQLAVLAHGPDPLLERADAYRAAWTGASTGSARDAGHQNGAAQDDLDTFVLDPVEMVAWGPFRSDDDAERFVASDKYLESWCALTTRGAMRRHRVPTHPPATYHGSWPVEA
jgi:hypothetical protein